MSEDSIYQPDVQAPPEDRLQQVSQPESLTHDEGLPAQSTPESVSTPEMYVFDPEKFDAEAERDIDNYIGWANGTHSGGNGMEPRRLQLAIRDQRRDQAQERVWSERFSGKVPKPWGEVSTGAPWHQIMGYIEAGRPLTDDMVEAAILYPVSGVPKALGIRIPLTTEQIELMERTGTLDPDLMEAIKVRQSSMRQPAAEST